jgi:hypothetical protein
VPAATPARPGWRRLANLVDAAALVLCAAVPVVVELVRGRERTANDAGLLFIPKVAWWWSRWRLPGGWDPWVFGGYPANADPQTAILHPLGLVYAAADPIVAAAICGAAIPAIAGLGMRAYLRGIGCGSVAAFVGGLSYSLGGFMAAHGIHSPKVLSAAAVPWALAAIESSSGPLLVPRVAISIALVLAGGHPQVVAYAMTLVCLYALLFGRLRVRDRLIGIAAGTTLGIAVVAAMWLPAVELYTQSTRAAGMVGKSDVLALRDFVTIVAPFARGGGESPLYGTRIVSSASCSINDCGAYPGMLAALALLAGLGFLVRDRRGRFWLLVAAVALVFANGAGTVLPLPGVRSPTRLLLWWSLAAAVVLGLVVHAEVEDPDRAPGVMAWLAAVAGVALVLGVAWWLPRSVHPGVIGSIVVLGAWTPIVLARGLRRPAVRPVALALCIADVLLFNLAVPVSSPPAFLARIRERIDGLRSTRDQVLGPASDSTRVVVLSGLLGTNWAPFSQVRLIQGYRTLVPIATARLLGARNDDTIEMGSIDDRSIVEPDSHMLDLLRCGLVWIPASAAAPFEAHPERWKAEPSRDAAWRVYRNLRVRPVAWLVHRTRVVPPEEAIALVRGIDAGPFDPATEALASSAIVDVLPADDEENPPTMVEYSDDVLRLEVSSRATALLVTSELAYPGWTAHVDGVSTPIDVVNAGFRAVVVPAGSHRVEFRYRPRLTVIGSYLSASALVVIVALVLVGVRARDRDGGLQSAGART